MIHLLDGNVLVALGVVGHIHADAAEDWLAGQTAYATCPITQGTLLRLLLRNGVRASDARALLVGLVEDDRHVFWPDDVGYLDVELEHIVGHRQVTDAYLAALAGRHGGRLATFDRGLAATHRELVTQIPVVA